MSSRRGLPAALLAATGRAPPAARLLFGGLYDFRSCTGLLRGEPAGGRGPCAWGCSGACLTLFALGRRAPVRLAQKLPDDIVDNAGNDLLDQVGHRTGSSVTLMERRSEAPGRAERRPCCP